LAVISASESLSESSFLNSQAKANFTIQDF